MAPFVIDFIRNQYTALPYPTQSFSGQTILVTGSNTGLGFEAAQHFVRLGASKVILAVRSLPKGEEAAEAIAHATGRQDVCEVWGLDMADFESVKRFVKRIEEEEKIDVALLNASISKTVFEECNGTEASIAVNVYGTFLLAIGLLPTLRKSAEVTGQKSKLTIVTSDAHFFASFNERKSPEIFTALADPSSPYMSDRYPTTKLLQILIIQSLSRQLSLSPHASSNPILNHVSPGLCYSGLMRDASALQSILMQPMFWLFARSTEVGSRNYVAAVSAGDESHGKWFSECVTKECSAFVRSDEGVLVQERVWKEMEGILDVIRPGILKTI